MTTSQVPAGWYPDPSGSQGERFWDGDAWTSRLRPRGGEEPSLVPEPIAQPASRPDPTRPATVPAEVTPPAQAMRAAAFAPVTPAGGAAPATAAPLFAPAGGRPAAEPLTPALTPALDLVTPGATPGSQPSREPERATPAPAAAESATAERARPNEYKVLTQKDPVFGGKFDLAKLEAALNGYAQEGWRVVSMATAPSFGLTSSREQLVVLLER